MKRIDVTQGTVEWERCRIGIPTASQTDRILTPKTRKLSSQSVTYRNQILAEWLLDMPIDFTGSNGWMDRGIEMEPEAAAWYEMQYDCELEEVGFCLRDDGLFGGSPDRFVGNYGIVEIKCPALHNHVGHMLGDGPDHTCQVQSYLALTEREWCDVVSYHPDLPPVVLRVERDQDFIVDLDKALEIFLADLEDAKAKLAPFRTEPDTIPSHLEARLRESLEVAEANTRRGVTA